MITSNMIYWITRLDGFCAAFEILAFVCGILLAIAVIFFIFNRVEENEEHYKVTATCLGIIVPVFLFFIFASVMTPNTKQAVAIYAIPKIANNEDMQEIPANTAKFLNEKLKDWIESTLEEKKATE